MSDLDKLLAIESIKILKARYFRYMDTRQWDKYEDLFTDDAVCDVSVAAVVLPAGSREDPWESPSRRADGVYIGGRAYRNYVESILTGVRSVHHGHMPEITIDSPTEARAIWAMEDTLEFPPRSALRGTAIEQVHGHGHYHETYRKVDGEWKISELAITRLRETRY